jgi:hypothetical protein
MAVDTGTSVTVLSVWESTEIVLWFTPPAAGPPIDSASAWLVPAVTGSLDGGAGLAGRFDA